MSARRLVVLLTVLSSAFAACGLDIGASGEGRACSRGRCSPGYVCNAEKRCVAPSRTRDAGVASGGAGGVFESTGGVAVSGSGGESGTGIGTGSDVGTGTGGAIGTGTGGAAGADAGADATTSMDGSVDASGECREPARYYRDADSDGFGAGGARSFCGEPPAGWVLDAGDCNDSDGRVFPGQTRYFGEGYATDSGQSFDYDCSGNEEPAPDTAGAAPDCPALALLVCLGSGYARTGRSGPGVDATCGSTAMVTCTGLLACTATTAVVAAEECR